MRAATSFPNHALRLSVGSGQALNTRDRRSLPAETCGLREVVQTSTDSRVRCLASAPYGRIFASGQQTHHAADMGPRARGDAGTIGCCFRVAKSVDGEHGPDFVHLIPSVQPFRPSRPTCPSWDLTPAERTWGMNGKQGLGKGKWDSDLGKPPGTHS